ncbi:response regulator transcription factor [Marinihelvus fidelis]|uniref:Response regulator transcription factor n=1 Tax=Marinihelvus fidelis TaxID=2613842 RepID=A0A5N0T9P3_9GAMM|nr:LytTR family DNA-binding domain-containing protein [Marinihelvus fidelis]KAA9130847.1 response regulator transcription factor [Marinihelvus fidelis]
MLKILVVDDEQPARSRLKRMLADLPGWTVVGESASGDAALEDIRRLEPDAVLLDISMPGLDGMSLARALDQLERPPVVVFCTAWPGQALDAFDSGAVDYLVKPVRAERLARALDKAARFVQRDAANEAVLTATSGHRTEMIEFGAVACFISEDKYTTVHHDDGEALISESLVELEKLFGDRLLRVHRAALVVRERICGLKREEGGAVRILLDGCDEAPLVSRRCLPTVRRVIKERKAIP